MNPFLKKTRKKIKICTLVLIIILNSNLLFAQKCSVTLQIIGGDDKKPIPSAKVTVQSLKDTKIHGKLTSNEGLVEFNELNCNSYVLRVHSIGYSDHIDTINIGKTQDTLKITLLEQDHESEELVVSATRSFRAIDDVPIRVELIPAEELDESITMGLASAKNVLGELPGVMSQGTSSLSGSNYLRLHGLDGKYTQMMIDGVPSFGGLNMNFSVLMLPPLNLKQLEIIKGSSAGLQSDAIGGTINFITREPKSNNLELSSVINHTSRGGTDLALWFGQRVGDLMYSLHSTYNIQPKVDIDGDKYLDFPDSKNININPKFSYKFNDKIDATLSLNYAQNRRLGGFIGGNATYENPDSSVFNYGMISNRYEALGNINFKLDKNEFVKFTYALNTSERKSYTGLYRFNGKENNSYLDIFYNNEIEKLTYSIGMRNTNQKFTETSPVIDNEFGPRDFENITSSIYTMIEYKFSSVFASLASFKYDINNFVGNTFVPRVSLMYKPEKELTIRASAGTGWRATTIFDERAEELGFNGVSPLLIVNGPKKENSISTNLDTKYQFVLGDLVFTGNLNLFYIQINHQNSLKENLSLNGPLYIWTKVTNTNSKGIEAIIQTTIDGWDFIFGYTFNQVNISENNKDFEKLLTPKHFINAAVLYEVKNTYRVVSDFMFQSPQHLGETINGYSTTPSVVTWGGSFEYWLRDNLSLFINVENLLDFRQTKYMPLYTGVPGQMSFESGNIWGPIEGRVFNAGIKYKL